MKHTTILLLAAALAGPCAAFLNAQERERPSRAPRERAEAEAPEPEKPEEAKAKEPDRLVAIVGGDVHVGDGSVMRRATVLIRNDKIEAVGHDVDVPEEAEVLDAKAKVVAPGLCLPIAPNVGTPSSGDSAKDGANPFDTDIKLGLAVGITSYLWQSGGGNDKPAGHSALVKLSWGDLAGMVAVEDPVVSMRVPLNAQQMRELRELVEKAREHLEALAQADTAKPTGEERPEARPATARGEQKKPPQAPKGTEEVLALIKGEKKLWISATRGFRGGSFDVTAIRQAIQVADLLGAGVVLVEPTEAWLLPDAIAASGSMAVVAPREEVAPDPGRPDASGSNHATAAILHRAGVPVAVTVARGGFGAGPYLGTGGILGQDLNTPFLDPAFAVRSGYPSSRALRTVTLDSARAIGVDSRVGSLEAGKDADVLILDGDPLNYKSLVETTLVNGKVVYQRDEEPYYQHVK